jgi:hypothetical protein
MAERTATQEKGHRLGIILAVLGIVVMFASNTKPTASSRNRITSCSPVLAKSMMCVARASRVASAYAEDAKCVPDINSFCQALSNANPIASQVAALNGRPDKNA